MCGIFGSVTNESSSITIDGCPSITGLSLKNDYIIPKLMMQSLNILKNRGYDSCGVYLNYNNTNKFLYKLGVDGELIKEHNKINEINDIFKILENNIVTNSNNSFNLPIFVICVIKLPFNSMNPELGFGPIFLIW